MSSSTRDGIAEVGGWVEDLLDEFGLWLARQRGLAPVTVGNYRWAVRVFLEALPEGEDLAGTLDARLVTVFMVEYCRERNPATAKAMARSVRSFLRFAHATGRTSVELWGAVPAPAAWRMASLPAAVSVTDVERLMAAASRARFTAAGRRDFAVLSLLVRLGLRRGEVARLGLSDIDWRAGEITVCGKGERVDRLPLLAEPGEAIAAWLCDGRPDCEARTVFTSIRPAGRPMTSGSVGHVVSSICQQAGLPRIGAHRLRHTLATEMLRAGASLPEIGQVLRHRSYRSTAIYAKVDEQALRPLARRWPTASVESGLSSLARTWPGTRS